MKFKIELLSIGLLSIILTSFGAYIDGDERNTSILLNVTEFMIMLFLVFTILSGIYFGIKIVFNKVKLAFLN